MERSNEILFDPHVRSIIAGKFKFYLEKTEELKKQASRLHTLSSSKDHKKEPVKIDRAGFNMLFKEIYKDNEGAIELMNAVVEHIFAIKANTAKSKAIENALEIDLEDF